MKVRITPNEVWPVMSVQGQIGRREEVVEVPQELVNDWLNAKSEVEKAEQRILDHLQRSGQPIPQAFAYRMGT